MLHVRTVLCWAVVAWTGGCRDLVGGDSTGRGARLYVSATGITLGVGDTTRLGVTLHDGTRTFRQLPEERGEWPAGRTVAWSVADPLVAAVSPAGAVTGRAPGRTVVRAESGGLADTGTVVVRAAGPVAPARFAAISLGTGHSCALTSDGAAYCWGTSWHGETGAGTARRYTNTVAPARVAGGVRFAALDAGSFHTCALDAAGAAHCWGDNLYGQLGAGRAGEGAVLSAPARAGSAAGLVAISAGNDRTCALTAGGAAQCWGRGPPGPHRAPGGGAFTRLSAGGDFACALDAAGAASCWGGNEYGQLGGGAAGAPSDAPLPIVGGRRFVAVSAGTAHACALTGGGEAYCWGLGGDGRLGTGSEASSLAPVAVAGGLRFAAISAGRSHTCAVAADGAAYCWGQNLRGQAGAAWSAPARPTPADLRKLVPTPVAGGLRFNIVVAGPAEHSCALDATGAAYCWGSNGGGELGVGTQDLFTASGIVPRTMPTPVVAP